MTGTTWFTSDLHFGHPLVAKIRGYANTIDHDAAIIKGWTDRVQDGDTVWVLGDLTGNTYSIKYALDTLWKLPGTKHLIAGNHDSCHPMKRDSYQWQAEYLTVFETVQAFARRKVNGQDILLSHFPYTGDHAKVDRHQQFRLPDKGLPLLHGHTHSNVQQNGHQICVGVDAWNMGPVSINTLTPMLDALKPPTLPWQPQLPFPPPVYKSTWTPTTAVSDKKDHPAWWDSATDKSASTYKTTKLPYGKAPAWRSYRDDGGIIRWDVT